jgi:DNA sulfur modification protein DndD
VKLSKLTVENFGPYFDRHEIDLGVTGDAPVVLVHGENARGKTSIANAIRWCLYKTAKGRGGIAIPTHRLMNNHAKENGVYHMSVSLEFEHAGSTYVLERHVQAARLPTEDGDLDFHLSLRKDGHFEAVGTIDRTIRDILPPQISRFFLFDGEMLNEYEDLLRDPDRNTQIVRQSIEQILGLPAVQRAAASLEAMRRGVERRQSQEARSRGANERLIADAQQKEEALSALEQDISNHLGLKSRLEQEREGLRQRLEQFGELQADLRQLDRYEEEIRAIDQETQEKKAEVQVLLKDGWWMPLEALLNREADAAQESARHASEAVSSREELHRTGDAIEAALSHGECTLCGHNLDVANQESLTEKLATTQAAIRALEGSTTDPFPALERLQQLRGFAGQGNLRVLREKEGSLRRLSIQRRRVSAEIDAIRERVRTDFRSEIGEIERQLEHCLTQLANVERLLTDAQVRQREAAAALQRLQNQIRSLPGANRRLASQAALYEGLRTLFQMSIVDFRDRLRRDVEREASDIHRQLSNDPGYGGLKINDQYGLTLVNEAGRVIPDRSAGAEQIVALSLIGALNRCATREGPIVMDTPFGRLDRGHRQKILRFSPQLGPQIVLLVQSGELERGRDLDALSGRIAREYWIERDGAPDRSRIVELS